MIYYLASCKRRPTCQVYLAGGYSGRQPDAVPLMPMIKCVIYVLSAYPHFVSVQSQLTWPCQDSAVFLENNFQKYIFPLLKPPFKGTCPNIALWIRKSMLMFVSANTMLYQLSYRGPCSTIWATEHHALLTEVQRTTEHTEKVGGLQ